MKSSIEESTTRKENGIYINCSKEEAFAAIYIILEGIIAEGSTYEFYEEAELCLKEIFKCQETNSKISQTMDNFLCELQLYDDYNSICRIFRYYYGYGLYTDKDYRKSIIDLIKYIRTRDDLKNEFENHLNYALTFFDDESQINIGIASFRPNNP